MTHYVCTGECGGVTEHPQNCATESCSRFNEPLVACNCTDGKHEEALKEKESTQ
jgi:hypothetical protein